MRETTNRHNTNMVKMLALLEEDCKAAMTKMLQKQRKVGQSHWFMGILVPRHWTMEGSITL